jgi:uncharacterized membrane protein
MSAGVGRREAWRTRARVVLGVVMIAIGLLHFVEPDGFARIVPRELPAPVLLVYVSGFFEIAGGVGLFHPRLRRLASWGLILLYVAVFPANINMAARNIQPVGLHIPEALLWLRLPLQLGFIAWALWVGRQPAPAVSPNPRLP